MSKTKIIRKCKELGLTDDIWNYLEHKEKGNDIIVTIYNILSYDKACDSCVVKNIPIAKNLF